MRRLAEAEHRIRELTNRARVSEHFFPQSRRDDWNCLCVALDTVGDSAIALLDFEERGLGSTEAERYLRLYGTLQALVLQQDAIGTIYRTYLGTSPAIAKDSAWMECRRIRNLAAGHPLNKRGTPEEGSLRIFLSRSSISEDGFDLFICEKNRPARFPMKKAIDLRTPYEQYKEEGLHLLEAVERAQEAVLARA